VSKENDRILGHADEADGIDEYDNPLPDWWLGLFWFTIIWAIGYTVHYHFIAERSFEEALANEMAAAEERWPEQARAEGAGAFVIDDQSVEDGEPVFLQNCSPCHSVDLSGGIGPSFVDEEWIQGGTARDVLRTIRQGVPAKGMVPWQGILSPDQINDVAAYILLRHMEATGRTIEDVMGDAGPHTPGGAEGETGDGGDESERDLEGTGGAPGL